MVTAFRKFTLATVSAAALVAFQSPLRAQEADDATEDSAQDPEIVVTGTNIRGTELIGSQVQTLSADDLAETGKATIAEVLRELPVNFAGGVAGADNSRGGQDTSAGVANLTGGTGVNLRGLGALSTLVLVNGRRVAASGQFGDFVDISNIPVAAIERIEILQDGASAVYGSDAVGGVVNIILKKRAPGLAALGRIGTTTEGGGLEYQGSLVWGGSLGEGDVVIGYEYNRRKAVKAADRNFNGGNFSDRVGVNWPIYTNRAGRAANIFSGGAAFNGNVAFTVPNGAGAGLTVAQLTPAVGGFGNSFDPWEEIDILPETERHSVFTSVTHKLGDRGELFSNARFTRREGTYSQGYAPIFSTVPSTNPAFITGTTNNFGVLFDDKILKRDVAVNSYAAETGLRYDLFGDWQATASLSFSREDQRRRSDLLRDSNAGERLASGAFAPSSLACSLSGINSSNIGTIIAPTPAQAFCGTLSYATFNPYSTQAPSAAVIDQLIGYESLKFRSDVIQGSVVADGTLFSLPGGDVKLAIGADLRREKIDGLLDFNYRSINPRQVPYGVTSQRVFSAFAELSLPIVGKDNGRPGLELLEFSAAVRHENSDSDNVNEFKTTNPKFGFKYAPVEGFTFSGSWGTSFHAPAMRFQYDGPQPVPGGNAIFYANAFYTAPCNTTLVALNGFSGVPGGAGNCTFTGMVVSGGAGPVLKPETSETWTLGVNIAPPSVPKLKFGINYFNIKIDDRLTRITAGALGGILANYFATGSSPFIDNLVFAPSVATTTALFNDPRFIGQAGPGPARTPGQIGAIIYATQTNLAGLKMDGLDLSASYGFEAGSLGNLDLFFNGTLITSYDIQGNPSVPFVDKLGLYESTGNPVEFKSKQGIAWTKGPFSMITTVNYTGGYQCAAGCFIPSATGAPVTNTAPLKIKSWTTVDLQLGYDLSNFGGAFNDLKISLSANNLFNQEPPFIDTGRVATGNAPEPYDASNATIIGRTVALTISKKF